MVLAKDCLSLTPAQVVFFCLGVSVKGSSHGVEQKARVGAQDRLKPYCRIWLPSPMWGRSPLSCGKGMQEGTKRRCLRKTAYSENVLAEVGGTFSPFSPYSSYYWILFSLFGVKSTFGGGVESQLSCINSVSCFQEPTDLDF